MIRPARPGFACVILAAAILGSVLLLSCGEDFPVLNPGDPAPPFALQDLDGRTVTLDGLRGEYVFVRFWADWCKSCRTEMPMIEEKYREFHDRGFEVLALNVRQDRDRAARFAREVRITYPVLLDRDGTVARAYGVIGLPTTLLVDREGKVREEIIGDMNRKSLSELLDPLFGETTTGQALSAR